MKLSELILGNENLIINERQQRKISKILKAAIDYPNCEHNWVCIGQQGYKVTGLFAHVGMNVYYKCSLCGDTKTETHF